MTDEGAGQEALDWDLEVNANQTSRGLGLANLRKSRFLIILLAKRDFTAIFKQSVLGPAWLIVQPVLKVAIYFLVFGRFMKVGTDGVPPILFYLTGLFFWDLFSNNVKKTSKAFIINQQVLSKVYFNRLVIPFSQMIANLVRSSVLFLLLAVVWTYYVCQGSVQLNWFLLTIPVLIILVSIFGAGVGMLVAAATRVYRDLGFAVESALQLLFYLTPVVYPISLVGEDFQYLLYWNPLVSILEVAKFGLFGVGTYSVISILIAAVFCVIVFLIGMHNFQKSARSFVDRI